MARWVRIGERTHPRKSPDHTGNQDQPRIAQPGRPGALDKNAAPAEKCVELAQQREKPGCFEELVEVALGRLEKERPPNQRDDQRRNHHRNHEEQPINVLHALAAASMNPHRHRNGWNHFNDVPKAQQQCGAEGLPKVRRLQEFDVIPKPDKFRDIRAVPAVEAVKNPACGRIVLEKNDKDQGRNNEEIDLPVVLTCFQRIFFALISRVSSPKPCPRPPPICGPYPTPSPCIGKRSAS